MAHGARVLDMVINVSRLKSGDYDFVRQDMAAVVRATPGVNHKVILETCLLTREERSRPAVWPSRQAWTM